MGAAVYIKLERETPACEIDGKSIARNWETLNELARQGDFPPLEGFLSTTADDLADLIGDDVVRQAGVTVPPEQWLDGGSSLAGCRQPEQRHRP